MDRSLFLVKSKILDVEGVRNSVFTGPHSTIISDSCDYVGMAFWLNFVFHKFLSKTLSPC